MAEQRPRGRRVQLGLGALDELPTIDEIVPPVPQEAATPAPSRQDAQPAWAGVVDLADVVENPVNRRESFGDLEELAASMDAVGQVQACAAVTREAFLRLYPEYQDAVGAARFVLVAGARRRRAAEINGSPLRIQVNDPDWATSRGQFYAACIAENGPRLDFQPWEEAVAIQELAQELGSNKAAAKRLGLSEALVSQRLSIFRLAPEMQELLRAGQLPIEPARTIAANVPPEEQMQVWLEQRWKEARQVPRPPARPGEAPVRRGRPPRSVRVQWPIGAEPKVVAAELAKVFDPGDLAALAEELRDLINDR